MATGSPTWLPLAQAQQEQSLLHIVGTSHPCKSKMQWAACGQVFSMCLEWRNKGKRCALHFVLYLIKYWWKINIDWKYASMEKWAQTLPTNMNSAFHTRASYWIIYPRDFSFWPTCDPYHNRFHAYLTHSCTNVTLRRTQFNHLKTQSLWSDEQTIPTPCFSNQQCQNIQHRCIIFTSRSFLHRVVVSVEELFYIKAWNTRGRGEVQKPFN